MSRSVSTTFSISWTGWDRRGITFDARSATRAIACTSGICHRFWRSMVGDAGGTVGVDHSFAEQIELGFVGDHGAGQVRCADRPWTCRTTTSGVWNGGSAPQPRTRRRCRHRSTAGCARTCPPMISAPNRAQSVGERMVDTDGATASRPSSARTVRNTLVQAMARVANGRRT